MTIVITIKKIDINSIIVNMIQQSVDNKNGKAINLKKEKVKELFRSLYLNLAQVALKRKRYFKAIEYASSVETNHVCFHHHHHFKALYRRSIAHLNRGDVGAFKTDLKALIQSINNNNDDDLSFFNHTYQYFCHYHIYIYMDSK